MGQPRRIMAARIGDSMPCETLYACNLCDKVKKEELRALLYTLFVQYGDVIDIVHMRTAKMRGQAFIVFEETSSATAALRALQGFNFLGREVKLEFARSKSFATAKRDGTFKPMQKEAEKRKAAAAAAVQLAKRANQTENGMELPSWNTTARPSQAQQCMGCKASRLQQLTPSRLPTPRSKQTASRTWAQLSLHWVAIAAV